MSVLACRVRTQTTVSLRSQDPLKSSARTWRASKARPRSRLGLRNQSGRSAALMVPRSPSPVAPGVSQCCPRGYFVIGVISVVTDEALAHFEKAMVPCLVVVSPSSSRLSLRRSSPRHVAGLARPGTAVLIVSTYSDDQLVEECIKAGAKGYVIKDIERFSLKESIRAVSSGGGVVSPPIAAKILSRLRTQEQSSSIRPSASLSEKQLEILRLIAAGFSNREIADRVDLSENTVKSHIQGDLPEIGRREPRGSRAESQQGGLDLRPRTCTQWAHLRRSRHTTMASAIPSIGAATDPRFRGVRGVHSGVDHFGVCRDRDDVRPSRPVGTHREHRQSWTVATLLSFT